MIEPAQQSGAPSPRQLADGARALAERHTNQLGKPDTQRSLIPLLTDAGTEITASYDAFARSAAAGDDLSAGAHWILDNFYVVRDQRTEALSHLRGKFFSELPYLASGPLAGYPRVFEVAKHLLETVDNAVDAETLTRFLVAYQDVSPLKLGELWAIPDALRIALLHHLSELIARERSAHMDRRRAVEVTERIRAASSKDPVEGVWVARELVEGGVPLPESFVQALVEGLQGDSGTTAVVEWLERRLASRSTSLQTVARVATQRQVSIAHAVTTLRWASDARWDRLVEQASRTERLLRRDPARVYRRMDFETRDRYRHAVEELARYSTHSELDVAKAAVARSEQRRAADPEDAGAHVGYHLIGEGAHAFEQSLGFRPRKRRRLARVAYRHPKPLYLGVVAAVTVLSELSILWVAQGRGVSIELLALVLVTALLPCIDLAVAFTNRLVAWVVPPRLLPKMDRVTGIGGTHRSLVAVPALLRSPEDARALVQALEIHASSNPSPLLRFALLSDFADAETETEPGDEATLAAARSAIRELNDRERDKWGDKFFLLHRHRTWNEAERVWMGWERKRGKIEELNALLRSPEEPTTYSVFEGDFFGVTNRDRIQFVISLDSDTRMPPGAALDLIRTAAHPLNRPVYDPQVKRVTHGYGILQPRISIAPRSASRSWFARVFSGNVGLDPYTTAVSDAYQDLFREGIFTGKGLYDVDAFADALQGVVPPNTVLSHDLLESTFARAALATDIELYDDYPGDYVSYAKRLHRWVRGDWQIVRWLLPRYRGTDGQVRRNPISVLGRWQILDNMRRSLTGPAMLLFLLAGWIALPRSPLFWTGVALAILAFPVYVNLTAAVFSRPRDAAWWSYFEGVGRDLRLNAIQTGLTIVFLAHTALYSLDAIVRALWRMIVTRRGMLEWATASEVEKQGDGSLGSYMRFMWTSILWAITSFILVTEIEPWAWVAAGPFVSAWIAAPWVAWRMARPPARISEELTVADRAWLRRMGRRTWSYFEDHVGPDTLWLPPDNVQANPYRGAAERTSPTNIGLGLLATQTAFDFGWIGDDELFERTEGAIESIDRLDSYRGHLFNWYSTSSGATLWPRYVSTVDSGNLVGSLIVLEQAFRSESSRAWPNPSLAQGLRDSVALARENLERLSAEKPGQWDRSLAGVIDRLAAASSTANSGTVGEWLESLGSVEEVFAAVASPAFIAPAPPDGRQSEQTGSAALVVQRLRRHIERERAALSALLPWWARGEPVPPAAAKAHSLDALEAALLVLRADDPAASQALESLRARAARRNRIATWCSERVKETDFTLVYDKRRELFSIGFDVDNLCPDAGYYDLLASEARLASYIAIACGQVPATHWFRLGRRATDVESGSALLSWSGTMFEYLMPLLFTASWPGTLLDETYLNAVLAQKRYGTRLDRPWGVSESAYNVLNFELDYQYRAFGVPGLGLRRGLGKDYVVAPYASALALMVLPASAVANLKRLEAAGAYGVHGFYDAIDYTASRLAPSEDSAVVQNWMAHHQGMILTALSNVLDRARVQRRFRSSPTVLAAELLLQERVPSRVRTIDPHPMEATIDPGETSREPPPVAYVPREALSDPSPRGGLLSNGRYSVLLTQAGTGSSRFKQWELTRWTPDRVTDPDGIFFYVRDLDAGTFWSVTPRPVNVGADRVDTWFHQTKVESALVHDWIESFVEVCVSPEDDVEIRRLTITNYGDTPRRLDVTSYIEIVLNEGNADRAHPAFSKLFVQTEVVPEHHALLATRRPRQHDAEPLWMFHTAAEGLTISAPTPLAEFETDRAQFIGRRRTLADPAALDPGATLSGSVGPVLDPIFSIRQPIALEPQQKIVINFALGVAPTRTEAIELADRYDNPTAAQRAIDLATAYGPAELEHLAVSGEEALKLQALGTAIVYADPRLRAPAEVLARNRKQQSGLWGYGISGDVPIVVMRVDSTDQMDRVREAIRAFKYWRLKGLDTDLVFLNEHPPSYLEGLHDLITQASQISASSGAEFRGKITVLRAEQLPPEDLDLILTVARAVFASGDLEVPPLPVTVGRAPSHAMVARPAPIAGVDGRSSSPATPQTALVHDNGFGGFSSDGAYVIRSEHGGPFEPTPLPWVNVVANPTFGFLASESGGGFSWSVNSHENRLSPWSNDPVGDRPPEVVYLRDDDEGVYGSAAPAPVPLPGSYETHHAFGSTTYVFRGMDVEHELTLFAAETDPVKVFLLTLRNVGTAPKNLSVFHYHEWVMGIHREVSARYVVTQQDEATGAVLARNPYNAEFAGRVAFVRALVPNGAPVDMTGDRAEFLGRGRDVYNPLGVEAGERLSGTVGAGLDPCAAWRVGVSLEAGDETQIAFVVGECDDDAAARSLLERFGTVDDAAAELERVRRIWVERMTTLEVSTPSAAIDAALNGWFMYQSLACRLWGRSAFYQSGGAFGFRDQLQDVMALLYVDPSFTRDQILLNSAHQFVEGDVLHWWHPPTGRGVRTRFSDDLLWLPFVTAYYVSSTGDHTLLAESAPFITARTLEDDEHEEYLNPEQADVAGDVYEHCCRAIDRSLTKGAHGLPLMGGGDWNDGMNRVGLDGGESVWLGFFLHSILRDFIPFCEARGDQDRVDRYRAFRKALGESLNDSGWDGEWYRRAYYGDGTPLGSKQNDECRIDAIAQAWSVLSGVAPAERARSALAAVDEHLVDSEGGLIRLLTPPFDQSDKDPGYIKGYVPGVRENGGQYTHGVLWVIQALAEMGDIDGALKAYEMIAPITHTATPERTMRYKAEPYVSVADIYSVPPHVGRGGWSWYTGSAGWMLRVALESLLGFTLENGDIRLHPRLPSGWPGYSVTYRPDPKTAYEIDVVRATGEVGVSATLDGKAVSIDGSVVRAPVVRDGVTHRLEVRVGS